MQFRSARELPRAPSTANHGSSLLKDCSNPATSGVGVFRQKIHFVLCREADDFSYIRQVMQMLEQRFQLARWRNPEQRAHRLVRFVEIAVRNAAWHAHEVAGLGLGPDPVQLQVERAFLDKDEFILGRMDMNRDEQPGLGIGLEGESRFGNSLRKIMLAENIPGLARKPFSIPSDTFFAAMAVIPLALPQTTRSLLRPAAPV